MKSWMEHGRRVTATNTRIVAIIGSNSCPKALFNYCLCEAKLSETPFVPQDEFYLDTRAIYFDHHEEHYLTHLINTPGHSDFVGEVAAALRIADGAIVVVDCELGVTQHTISLARRAIEEHVRLVLLLDKVESLLNTSPDEASEMLDLMLWKLNSQVPVVHNKFSLINDNIVFGSLEYGWIVSYDQLSSVFSVSSSTTAASTTFTRNLHELIKRSESKDLSTSESSSSTNDEKIAIEQFHRAMRELCGDKALYEMTVNRLPSPVEAQKYRATHWYSGSHTDEVLKTMSECDSEGPIMVLISKIVWGKLSSISSKMAPFAVGRVCSGSIRPNQQLYRIASSRSEPPQVVSLINMYAITNIAEELEECSSGNIVLIPWPDKLFTRTLSSSTTASDFTAIYPRTYSPTCLEYSVTSAGADAELLRNALISLFNCDHAATVTSDDWHGNCIAAVGTKHAEVLLKRLKDFVEVDLVINGPFYKYRESITAPSSVLCLSKSPNKINRVWTRARPMDSTLRRILSSQNLPFDDIQKNMDILSAEYLFVDEKYVSLPDLAEPNVVVIDKTLMKSLSIHGTPDWIDSLRAGSSLSIREGVLCEEPLIGAHFTIEDVLIAVDTRRRGAGQLIPMFRRSFFAAQLTASPVLLEAVLFVEIHVPHRTSSLHDIYEELARKRATLIEEEYLKHSNVTLIRCHVPVVENLEMHKGVVSSCFFSHWERVPGDPLEEGSFANDIVLNIRKRKGLKESIPGLDIFLDKL